MVLLKRIDDMDWNEVKKSYRHIDGCLYEVDDSVADQLVSDHPKKWAVPTDDDCARIGAPSPAKPTPPPNSGTISTFTNPELTGGTVNEAEKPTEGEVKEAEPVGTITADEEEDELGEEEVPVEDPEIDLDDSVAADEVEDEDD